MEFLQADRLPCPVCGHPTGDCVGEQRYQGSLTVFHKAENDPRATFRVPRRIYEEVEINGKLVKKLLYARGASITPEEAKRLGLLPK